jgi:hypothetical protein
MTLTVRRYETRDVEKWDSLVAASWNGTFLHARRFLSYHGERFWDLSLVIEDDRGRIVGVFPAAHDNAREDIAVSHPGLTYGGVVHDGRLRGAVMLEALQAIAWSYREEGLHHLRYKAVPYIYHRVPSSDDLYALFRLGARRYRCDLSATIDLEFRLRPSKLRRRDLRKAQRFDVQVESGPHYLAPFWTVVEQNLATKYETRPVHTLEEITKLNRMFPDQIECVVGLAGGEVVAGIVLFRTLKVVHAQYIASTTAGNTVAALSAVMEHAIAMSKECRVRYFSFGTSNEHEGRMLNEGLHRFKVSFGAGGVVHEYYEVSLDRDGGE